MPDYITANYYLNYYSNDKFDKWNIDSIFVLERKTFLFFSCHSWSKFMKAIIDSNKKKIIGTNIALLNNLICMCIKNTYKYWIFYTGFRFSQYFIKKYLFSN